MPSKRKRIGYLPSTNIQEIITKVAKRENLSQSKVVGILVEEALIARGLFDSQNPNNISSKVRYRKESNINNSTFKHGDLDEFISDKGIIYKTQKNTKESDNFLDNERKDHNQELFDQFRKFILFQKTLEEK